jgi:hypothetical protein
MTLNIGSVRVYVVNDEPRELTCKYTVQLWAYWSASPLQQWNSTAIVKGGTSSPVWGLKVPDLLGNYNRNETFVYAECADERNKFLASNWYFMSKFVGAQLSDTVVSFDESVVC